MDAQYANTGITRVQGIAATREPELLMLIQRLRELIIKCHENASEIEAVTRNLGGSVPIPNSGLDNQKQPAREECVTELLSQLIESAESLLVRTSASKSRLRELVG